jgi:TatD DNase family protein
MFVDSHCHLVFPELRSRLPEILADMRSAEVVGALNICTTMEEADAVREIAEAHPNLWASVGVHPDTEDGADPSLEELIDRAGASKVIAIGETGLDYYRLNGRSVAEMEWQRERFRRHIRAAIATGKPLVIHTRSASADTLAILKEEGGERAGGVFHCFTETRAVAEAALDLGFHVSFSGIVTFRNAQDLRETAAFVPADRLLIETDSPYLAPVPYRGKTNTPAYVPWVGRQIAELRKMPLEAVAEVTRLNFERLFKVSMPAE